MRHPNLIKWEKELKSVLDDIDVLLEERYGKEYDLHPARRKHGSTSNRSHDGLFDIRGDFTLGLGSKNGRGYIVDIDIKTLENIPQNIIDQIENETIKELKERLTPAFPDRELKVEKDGNVIKIVGDLSLGDL
jgi:hypothetical protein